MSESVEGPIDAEKVVEAVREVLERKWKVHSLLTESYNQALGRGDVELAEKLSNQIYDVAIESMEWQAVLDSGRIDSV